MKLKPDVKLFSFCVPDYSAFFYISIYIYNSLYSNNVAQIHVYSCDKPFHDFRRQNVYRCYAAVCMLAMGKFRVCVCGGGGGCLCETHS